MQVKQSTSQALRLLWGHISPRRQRQFGFLMVLMLLTSFAEILSIGAVMPFLAVLTSPENVFNLPAAKPFLRLLGLTDPMQLLLPLAIAFGSATIIAGVMRLALLWATTRLSFATGADLGITIYRRTLYQPYAVHCARNSSEVISGISGKANNIIYGTIMPVLTLISTAVMLIVILIALLSVEPVVALLAFGGFGLIYICLIRLTRKKVLINSQCIARDSVEVIKALQEGLGGIRDVLIDGSQAAYCQIYQNADHRLRQAQASTTFIGASPRYGVEALGMLLIIMLAYILAQQSGGVPKAIPILGALAVGAQRLLPLLQQSYVAWTGIQSDQVSLRDALKLLDQPLPDYAGNPITQPLHFKHDICFKQLEFCYNKQTPNVLKQINLTINRGDRIGFIGSTGSGKSTFLDIAMGLLEPTGGTLEVDGQVINALNQRAWQLHIAHVPQVIFLADSSIEENIAFGVPKELIDHDRVMRAAHQAQIVASIESWPKGYKTFVGERGVRLSGGQRQRIGIARALYKEADVIIFDEATSALDSKTEEAVMQSIESLSKDLTLLIAAHRITTLKNCTLIVELAEGSIKRIGNYDEFVNQLEDPLQSAKDSSVV
jgi:ABC-type bacteriocin/lantibiotic exporter with double-glycine peptidase domain